MNPPIYLTATEALEICVALRQRADKLTAYLNDGIKANDAIDVAWWQPRLDATIALYEKVRMVDPVLLAPYEELSK